MWTLIQPYLNTNLIEASEEEMDTETVVSTTTRRSTTSRRSSTASQLLQQAQRHCKHEKVLKSGSNQFKIQEKCAICGKITKEELTEVGIQKEKEREKNRKKKLEPNEPTYEEFLEWKRSQALEPAGVWTGSRVNR